METYGFTISERSYTNNQTWNFYRRQDFSFSFLFLLQNAPHGTLNFLCAHLSALVRHVEQTPALAKGTFTFAPAHGSNGSRKAPPIPPGITAEACAAFLLYGSTDARFISGAFLNDFTTPDTFRVGALSSFVTADTNFLLWAARRNSWNGLPKVLAQPDFHTPKGRALATLVSRLTLLDILRDEAPQNALLKDLDPRPTEAQFDAVKPWTNPDDLMDLPLGTQKFRDYLEGLTISELSILRGRLPRSMDARTAVSSAQKIIQDQGIQTPVFKASTLAEIVTLYARTLEASSSGDVSYRTGGLLGSSLQIAFGAAEAKPWGMKILQEALEESLALGEPLRIEDLNLFNYFLGEKVTQWVSPHQHSELLVRQLREKMSAREVVNLTAAVAHHGDPLTPRRWDNFLNSYDSLGGLPPELWIPLVQ